MTKEESKKIDQILSEITGLKVEFTTVRTVLLGENGDEGLVGQVKDNTKGLARVKIILAALIGSGVLSGAGIGIANLIS